MEINQHTKLTVTSEDRLEKDPSFYMTSAFEELLPDGTWLIAAPVIREIQMPVQVGEMISISFIDKRSSYGLDAVVLERLAREGFYYLKVRPVTEIKRVQRRQDFRLEIALDGKLDQSYVDMNGDRKVRRIPLVTKDVSAGGTFMRLNSQLFANETVVIYLPLGRFGSVKAFPATVRWCVRAGLQDRLWKWDAGLMFLHKDNAAKEELIKYLFTLQQRIRKSEAEKEMR